MQRSDALKDSTDLEITSFSGMYLKIKMPGCEEIFNKNIVDEYQRRSYSLTKMKWTTSDEHARSQLGIRAALLLTVKLESQNLFSLAAEATLENTEEYFIQFLRKIFSAFHKFEYSKYYLLKPESQGKNGQFIAEQDTTRKKILEFQQDTSSQYLSSNSYQKEEEFEQNDHLFSDLPIPEDDPPRKSGDLRTLETQRKPCSNECKLGQVHHRTKSATTKVIGVGGGDLELKGFKVHFPENAVDRDLEFELSIDSNRKNYPKDKGVPIAPILEVKPAIKFKQPVKVKMVTWYSAAKGKELIADVLTKEENEDWKEDQEVTLSDKNEISFDVWHFSKKISTISKESSVDGLYYFCNEVYIQRDTASIFSTFYLEGTASVQQEERYLKTGFVPASPEIRKIYGKSDSDFLVKVTSMKPQDMQYSVLPDTTPRFKISQGLEQDIICINFFTLNFPEDYRGSLLLSHSVTPSCNPCCDIQSSVLTLKWPISSPSKSGDMNVYCTNDNSKTAMNMANDQGSIDQKQTETKSTLMKK